MCRNLFVGPYIRADAICKIIEGAEILAKQLGDRVVISFDQPVLLLKGVLVDRVKNVAPAEFAAGRISIARATAP